MNICTYAVCNIWTNANVFLNKGVRMKALSSQQMERIKVKCDFFDFKNAIADIEILIQFEDQNEIVRFKEFYHAIDKMIFKNEVKRLISIIKWILNEQDDQECIILKEYKKWTVEPKETPKLYSVLKKNHINNRKTEGILVNIDSEWYCIELLIKAIFQCNTSAIFILPKSKCVFAPTDHMDIFLYCKNITLMEKIRCSLLD